MIIVLIVAVILIVLAFKQGQKIGYLRGYSDRISKGEEE